MIRSSHEWGEKSKTPESFEKFKNLPPGVGPAARPKFY